MTASSPSTLPQLAFSDDDVTFFTIGDEAFFGGVAGLVNSLRRHGYTQRIVIADCGFTASQRHKLGSQATLIPLSRAEVKIGRAHV